MSMTIGHFVDEIFKQMQKLPSNTEFTLAVNNGIEEMECVVTSVSYTDGRLEIETAPCIIVDEDFEDGGE